MAVLGVGSVLGKALERGAGIGRSPPWDRSVRTFADLQALPAEVRF
jgi:hypothetical protein